MGELGRSWFPEDDAPLVDPRVVSAAAAPGAPVAPNAQPQALKPQFSTVPRGSPEFVSIEQRMWENRDWLGPARRHWHKDYPGVAFKLLEARRVDYGERLKEFDEHAAQLRRDGKSAALKMVFHGCRRLNTSSAAAEVENSLARNGLLPFGQSDAAKTDEGWFGDGSRGVYVAKHLDYCLKYANPKGLTPVKVGETLKVLMLKLCPGRILPLSRRGWLPPTPGYDCHQSSLKEQELYVYDQTAVVPAARARGPRQLLLTHILTIQAIAAELEVAETDDY